MSTRTAAGRDAAVRLRRRLPDDETGTGPVTAVFSVAILLGFLLLATQVLVHLYASSVVGAAAFDAARRAAATAVDGPVDCALARTRARDLLGGYAARLAEPPTCTVVGDQVHVRIAGPTPAQLLGGFGASWGAGIDRTAAVRVERFR